MIHVVTFLLMVITLFMCYKFCFKKRSKYLSVSKLGIHKKIFMDVIYSPYWRKINRNINDEDIKKDFYKDVENFFENLPSGKYKTVTHGFFKRKLMIAQREGMIKFTKDLKIKKNIANINFTLKIIGVRNIDKEKKQHQFYSIYFEKLEQN